jgi:hypothetical protein
MLSRMQIFMQKGIFTVECTCSICNGSGKIVKVNFYNFSLVYSCKFVSKLYTIKSHLSWAMVIALKC